MKKTGSKWLWIFLWLAATPLFAGGIKVVTWNMRWFPGGNPDAKAEERAVQMKRAQEALRKIKPDIFLCQEVASWEAVQEVTSVVPGLQPAVVSDFGPASENAPAQNVGIATRFPADSGWWQRWKEIGVQRDAGLPRGFAFAAIELPDHTMLLTYTVHLKSNYKSRETEPDDRRMREESSRLLQAHIHKMQEAYGRVYGRTVVLVGGDFNTSLDDDRFKKERTLRDFLDKGFNWGFAQVPESERFTIRASRDGTLPAVTFDHFFTLGLGAPKARVLDIRRASDHMPVEIVIPSQ